MRLSCSATLESRIPAALPATAVLRQNYPNPFTSTTRIGYDLHEEADITLDVVDVRGAVVMTLVSGRRERGSYTVDWNASGLPSGVYALRLRSVNFALMRVIALNR